MTVKAVNFVEKFRTPVYIMLDVVKFASLKQAVLNRVPIGIEEINLKALEIGFSWEGKY